METTVRSEKNNAVVITGWGYAHCNTCGWDYVDKDALARAIDHVKTPCRRGS